MGCDLRRVRVVLEKRVVARVGLAQSSQTRLVGLLGRNSLESGDGLLIRPCNMVHTWFMRFPIDVAFLANDGRITRCAHRLPPFRSAWGGWHARAALELTAGSLRDFGALPGQRLEFDDPSL